VWDLGVLVVQHEGRSHNDTPRGMVCIYPWGWHRDGVRVNDWGLAVKKVVVRDWLEALRSEEYQQCLDYERFVPEQGRVQHDPWGVLAELCQDALQEESELKDPPGTPLVDLFREEQFYVKEGVASHIINWPVLCEWAGIPEQARYGHGPDGEILRAALKLNDEGKPFALIANYIEMAYASF
jgi:hypothetical protein